MESPSSELVIWHSALGDFISQHEGVHLQSLTDSDITVVKSYKILIMIFISYKKEIMRNQSKYLKK